MKLNKALALILFSTFGISCTAFAQGFISVSVGESTPSDNLYESDIGFRVLGGTKVDENLSLEMGYAKLGQFDAGDSSLSQLSYLYVAANVKRAYVNISGFDLSLVGLAPLNNQFIAYGRVGFYAWSANAKVEFANGNSVSNNADGIDPLFGIGVGYKIESNLTVSTEFSRYKAYDDTSEFASISTKYQF